MVFRKNYTGLAKNKSKFTSLVISFIEWLTVSWGLYFFPKTVLESSFHEPEITFHEAITRVCNLNNVMSLRLEF